MWLLSDIGEYRGMQKMFARQMPQKLKSLKEFAIIESVVSSNRIEGIIIDHKRIKPVNYWRVSIDLILKKAPDRNRTDVISLEG